LAISRLETPKSDDLFTRMAPCRVRERRPFAPLGGGVGRRLQQEFLAQIGDESGLRRNAAEA